MTKRPKDDNKNLSAVRKCKRHSYKSNVVVSETTKTKKGTYPHLGDSKSKKKCQRNHFSEPN